VNASSRFSLRETHNVLVNPFVGEVKREKVLTGFSNEVHSIRGFVASILVSLRFLTSAFHKARSSICPCYSDLSVHLSLDQQVSAVAN